MYSRNAYYLFRFKRIKDIRIAYAPPRDLGNFGGDIDNWMWPRQTCDFTFLRAYVSKDNEGVDYSTNYADTKLEDIPACFLNTTSVTGGNSGFPTLNAKGEQIGIIYDMTYKSVTADYYEIPELQRTISADIRYVLFVTDKFSGAKYIIRELGF